MKRSVFLLLILACALLNGTANAYSPLWQAIEAGNAPFKGKQQLFPERYMPYVMNDTYIKTFLFSLSDNASAGQQIELPDPEGGSRTFVIWQSHLMAEGLAARYPQIRTFTAYAATDPRIVAKIDYTQKGFHAMVYNGSNTYFIDPHSNVNDGVYICYYKHDYIKPLAERMACEFDDEQQAPTGEEPVEINTNSALPKMNYKVLHGTQKRTYRLALACTYEYSVAVDGNTPTKTGVLSAMVTSVNRVTGVYELEMAISLQLIGNTDTLIYITSADPYSNGNGSTMLGQNQTNVTNLIGGSNYDIGHVFSTGGGGIASLGSICASSSKAQGVTGSGNPVGDAFDIDYVAHEMGHQFGGPHTFNNNTSGSCSGNRSGNNAYEPGSGSTIMAYAGICAPDNIQAHSDAYFHSNSLQNIYNTITQSSKNNCPVKVNTGNAPSGIPSFTQTYYIPFLTPFELTAPAAIDSAATDTLTTYCWEQYDRGAASTWANASTTGPIFRSFSPTESRTRVFPVISKLVNNVTSYLGEKLPPDARTLRFKLAVRSVYQGIGATNYSDDSIRLNVINTTTPFAVTSPNSSVTWNAGSAETVTWDVSGTTSAPISCANVDIFLSTDGGFTYPTTLATNVPNSGSASVIVPNVAYTNKARVKVKGAGNVFFDISNANFNITWPLDVQGISANAGDVQIFPVPASDVLNISNKHGKEISISVVNTMGQTVWTGVTLHELQIDVKSWAKGIYYICLKSENGQSINKKVVVQ